MSVLHKDAQVVGDSDDKIYFFNLTTSTFIKREKPLAERGISKKTGRPIENPLFKERFRNEAAALQLIRRYTKIPVPGLRSWGEDSEGLLFLETDLVPGVQLERAGEKCRMPNLHSLNEEKVGEKCDRCADLAQKNFNRFVEEKLLPELRSLKSSTTGLDGLVIPPTWMILGAVDRPSCETKTSDEEEYVMTHGDLGPHNVMMDVETLEVISIIDWEYSGYFPPEFQKWGATREEHFAHFKDEDLARKLAATIGL
ncbi:uncharacterized protein RSE6_15091 [Rhynchosporium secalis]|uniref:Aminoglycoside phosphotransferase domain-containing protein n=1 Tax=Rhynchosporium secalis TaxID=38038 RepID=A0A1E1MWX0_RHYSE|nr:uncharacterized protein RSE6_15091 [Rhynchosporium secalis]